jgi:hypothetical protein
MTLLETEDIARECRDRAGWRPPAVDRAFLLAAAEAIDWLLEQLTEAEGVVEYLEQFEP